MADLGTGLRREPPLGTLTAQQAQLARADRQADAVGGAAADEVRLVLQPMQADQRRPAIGPGQAVASVPVGAGGVAGLQAANTMAASSPPIPR
ncbi:hypothetical protein G6F63_016469 [Rhizopus arrhizus]|nr:hypothetical protein G6F63_016469 [Rhizopus arrhizus]